MSADRRRALCSPLRAVPCSSLSIPWQRHSWQWPCSLPVAPSHHRLSPSHCMTSGSQTPPPTTCMWCPCSMRDSAASLPHWACRRGRCLSLTFPPYRPDSTCEGENKKKRNRSPSPPGEECTNPQVCGFHFLVSLSLCFKTKPARWYSALHSQPTSRTWLSLR